MTLFARADGLGEVDVLVPHHAHAEGVDERVALVAGVEDGLAADVRQAEAVAVAADAGHHAGTTRRVSGWSIAPKRRESMTPIGRAPMAMMSRTIPPTPVAAPW